MTLFVICSKCILWMYLQVCSRSCICSRISRHSNELTCHIVSNLNRAHLRCTWAQNELEMHLPFRYKGRNGAWHTCVCALAAAVCARSTKWINFFPAYSSAVNSVKVHTFDLFFCYFCLTRLPSQPFHPSHFNLSISLSLSFAPLGCWLFFSIHKFFDNICVPLPLKIVFPLWRIAKEGAGKWRIARWCWR